MQSEAGEKAYELTQNFRPLAVAMLAGAFVMTGLGSVGEANIGSAVAFVGGGLLLGARAAQILLRWPTEVILRRADMVFIAKSREWVVPWGDLKSVRVSHGRYSGSIRWKLAHGRPIASAATFADLHHLLVEVERHAPHARVTI